MCVFLTVVATVLSFVGGSVSGIILGIFLSVAAYNIKNKTQMKSNQTPVYDCVGESVGGVNSQAIHMEENDAYGLKKTRTENTSL